MLLEKEFHPIVLQVHFICNFFSRFSYFKQTENEGFFTAKIITVALAAHLIKSRTTVISEKQ